MKTTSQAIPHPTEEQLESYALGRLAEPELERVETHLFVCHACQDALVETDEYVALMKSALAEPSEEPATLPFGTRLKLWGTEIADAFRFPRPVPMFSTALAALSLAAVLSQTYPGGLVAHEADVTLRAVRGGAESPLAQGPADRTLRLRIESRYLTAAQEYEARIVDAAGRPAWEGSGKFSPEGGLVLRLDKQLNAGTYWVRLHDAQDKLLQEYGLQLR